MQSIVTRTSGVLVLVLLALPLWSQEQKLGRPQQQAVDRQSRNLAEAQKKLADFMKKYTDEMKELAGMVVPPGFLKNYINQTIEIESKCDAITNDLEKSACPKDNPKVKAILDWIDETRPQLAKLKKDLEPKIAEAEKMADPKNYPDLEADFQQIDDLGDAYRIQNFMTYPDKVAKLATDFPQMTKWCSERFAKYKNLIVISGGKDSPLYKRYEKTAKAIQGFQKSAGDFVKNAESAVPTKLAEAEKMGDEAAKNKKPAFFTGGVKQKLDEAQGMMKVCRAFLKADDKRMIALETAYAKTKKATDAQAASLKELITAEMRAPADNYTGDDKKAIEKEILDAWKEKWPKDKVLGLRFHMKQFDRRVEWTYYEASSMWKKSDVSVLCITVIVQTSDTIATMYPSYVNIDNLSSKRTLGVDTKGGIYVNEEMLVKNL